MWNFSDLAKKAQELQDQAADAASSLSAPSTFFNLDAMRSDTTGTNPAAGEVAHDVPLPQSTIATPSSFSHPILPPTTPTRTAPLGALKLPSKKLAVPVSVASDASASNNMADTARTSMSHLNLSVTNETVASDAMEHETHTTTETSHTVESEPDAAEAGLHVVETPDTVENTTVPVDVIPDLLSGETVESTQAEESNASVDIAPSEPLIVMDVVSEQPKVDPFADIEPAIMEVTSSPPDATDSVALSDAECAAVATDATIVAQEMDDPVRAPPLDPAPSTPSATSANRRGLSRRTKLVVLVSSSSINRQVKVRQDLVETALTAVGVEFESLDGALEQHKELRNELFDVSGQRGEYPQFFLVDLDHGGTVFWGGWEQFQHTNDDGKLLDAFGYHGPAVPPTPVAFYESHGPVTEPPSQGAASVPDEVLEHFSNQIKRIEENYQIERVEIEKRHAQELRDAANHEPYERALRETEERLMTELRTKEEQLQEVCRRNEGYRLKMDVLKREVTGTQELLQARDSDVGKANQKYLTDLRAMEKQLVSAETKAEASVKEVETLQKSLETTRVELATSTQEHDELKQRVKTLAGELKERRSECRQLQSRVEELTEQIRTMRADMDSLQERLNHQGMSQTEKDGEMHELQAKLAAADVTLKTAEKEWKARELKSEQALVDYKKKAQNSLSMANSRTSSAVQAREEAEMDARAARATADSAFERATKAEISSREAVAAAKAAVQEREDERNTAVVELEKAQAELRENESKLVKTNQKLEQAMASKEKKAAEIERLLAERAADQSTVSSLQKQIAELTRQNNIMRGDVDSLRDQLHHAKAMVDMKASKVADEGEQTSSSSNGHGDETSVSTLRQELREANDAIEDLKAALANAVEINERKNETFDELGGVDDSERSSAPVRTNAGSESIPLFYAMEKQAELKTARTEMNRLASVLADVQSEKTEAFEAMEAMKRRMEDAEARLKRFEKLGSTPTGTVATQNGEQPPLGDSGAVNIEYLKHIMLRFLNAKAVAERKALVPVIGAVLELTPNELQAAVQNVEQSAAGVGSTIFGFLS